MIVACDTILLLVIGVVTQVLEGANVSVQIENQTEQQWAEDGQGNYI